MAFQPSHLIREAPFLTVFGAGLMIRSGFHARTRSGTGISSLYLIPVRMELRCMADHIRSWSGLPAPPVSP